jgi:hypothetical protein
MKKIRSVKLIRSTILKGLPFPTDVIEDGSLTLEGNWVTFQENIHIPLSSILWIEYTEKPLTPTSMNDIKVVNKSSKVRVSKNKDVDGE